MKVSVKTIIAVLSILGTLLGAGIPALFYVMDQRYQHNHKDTVTMIDQHVAMHNESIGIIAHEHDHGHQNVNDWQNNHMEIHVNRNDNIEQPPFEEHHHSEFEDLEETIDDHYHVEFDSFMEILQDEKFRDEVLAWLEGLQDIVNEHNDRLEELEE